MDTGDLGRRAALRRHELGLSREEVAEQTGMAVAYLAYLEEQPAQPSPATVMRLASALGTTPQLLLGGLFDVPPGRAAPSRASRLEHLDRETCLGLISPGGVGRVVLVGDGDPSVLPVNYALVDGAVVFRTEPSSSLARTDGKVAFEVDHVDEALQRGWSVLVVGQAAVVTDPGELSALAGARAVRSWAPGRRDLVIRIEPGRVTGRRVLPV